MIFFHGQGVAVTKHTNKWISDLVVKKKNEISVLAGLENPKIEKKSKSKKKFFPKQKKKFFLPKNHC